MPSTTETTAARRSSSPLSIEEGGYDSSSSSSSSSRPPYRRRRRSLSSPDLSSDEDGSILLHRQGLHQGSCRRRLTPPAASSPASLTSSSARTDPSLRLRHRLSGAILSCASNSGGDNDCLPKSIQLYPPSSKSTPSSNGSINAKHRSLRLIALASTFLSIVSFIIISSQQAEISALRSQLEITNQHRASLYESHASVETRLHTAERSLEEYQVAQRRLSQVNHDMRRDMNRLRGEYAKVIGKDEERKRENVLL